MARDRGFAHNPRRELRGGRDFFIFRPQPIEKTRFGKIL
jgi:hypothetical protein